MLFLIIRPHFLFFISFSRGSFLARPWNWIEPWCMGARPRYLYMKICLTYTPRIKWYVTNLNLFTGPTNTQSFLKNVNNLKPLFDRVLVQRIKPATQTSSGIYIPEKNQEKLNEGTVVAAGPGVTDPTTGKLIPVVVKAGDKVLLPNFGGSPVKVGEDEFLLFSDREILAKIEN